MSFSPPFKSVFEPGDLVYGDQYDRKFFLWSGIVDPKHFDQGIDMKLTSQSPFSTFEARTQKGRQIGMPSIIDDLNNYLSEYEKKQEGKIKKINANLIFIDETLASRFNSFLHDSSYNKNKINKPSSKFDWEYEKIKEQCKAGLDFQTRGKGVDGQGGGVIHFILGPILLGLMEYIVEKNNPVLDKTIRHYFFGEKSGLFVTEKKRHITGAEIRWVYRNRKDTRVQNKIQFWRVSPHYEKLYSIKTLVAKENMDKIMRDAVFKHFKTQKENNALKKDFTNIFSPCYPPWTPQFSITTAALWEQYKPKSEHDDPLAFLHDLINRAHSPALNNRNNRRKFTIDERKF